MALFKALIQLCSLLSFKVMEKPNSTFLNDALHFDLLPAVISGRMLEKLARLLLQAFILLLISAECAFACAGNQYLNNIGAGISFVSSVVCAVASVGIMIRGRKSTQYKYMTPLSLGLLGVLFFVLAVSLMTMLCA